MNNWYMEGKNNMKKIIVFNGWYLPSKRCGGPVTSIRNAVNACCDEFEFYIIALNHDFGNNTIFENIQEGWNQVGNAKVKYIPDHYYDFNMDHLMDLFDEVSPDLIWFSGILHPEIKLYTMRLSRKMNIPVLFSPRGEVSEDRVTTLKVYKKLPYLWLSRLLGFYKGAWFHATSQDEHDGLIKYIGAPEDKINYVANIPVMPESERISYRKEKGTLRIVFISRIHMVKNLKFAVEMATKLNGKVEFDVYGPIEVPSYWDECLEIAAKAPTRIQVTHKGVLSPDEVGETFYKYDCFLFPTFNENYGHVIAESMANGCPVVLSKGTTPWDDMDTRAGYICDLDKPQEFVDALNRISEMDELEFKKLSDSTLAYYREKIASDSAITGHKNMFRRITENGK